MTCPCWVVQLFIYGLNFLFYKREEFWFASIDLMLGEVLFEWKMSVSSVRKKSLNCKWNSEAFCTFDLVLASKLSSLDWITD